MSRQNPGVQSPPPPDPDDAIRPTAPDFVETAEVAPLSGEREPLPFWLYLLCGFALFLAGSSFTGFSVFGAGALDQGPGGPVLASASSTLAQASSSPIDIGKGLYGNNCANCHQGTGAGQPGSYPPLSGSEWVMGSKERLSGIMLSGLAGPVTVEGGSYGSQAMPGWAGNFTDEKLADIMTYIRVTWGNKGDPVTAADVSAARAKFAAHLSSPYCEADLLKIAPNAPGK